MAGGGLWWPRVLLAGGEKEEKGWGCWARQGGGEEKGAGGEGGEAGERSRGLGGRRGGVAAVLGWPELAGAGREGRGRSSRGREREEERGVGREEREPGGGKFKLNFCNLAPDFSNITIN